MPKILLAVDGSDASRHAAQRLVELARWMKEAPEVHVLTVHLAVPLAGRVSAALGKAALDKYYAEEEAEAMKPGCDVLDAAGIRYTRHTQVGDIAETIVGKAKALGADLIVMGTHGRGKVGTMLLGSVAQKVLNLATVPVLLGP